MSCPNGGRAGCPPGFQTTCPDATAPANINTKTPYKCEGKCKFSFTFEGLTTNSISNNGNWLTFSLYGPNASGATYDGITYKPKHIQLFSPSIHEYDSRKADAESIIVLEAPARGYLYICTPLEKAASSGPLDAFVTMASERAPTVGTSFAVSEKVNVEGLCPMSKFFTYSGTGLGKLSSCDAGAIYVVYAPPSTAAILPGTIDKLRCITEEACGLKTVPNPSVVVSLDGPGGGVGGGDIYIKCEPTGHSRITKEVAFDKVNIFDPANFGNVWSVLMGLFAMLLMWAIWTAFSKLLSSVLGPASMTPLVPSGA